MGQWHFVEGRRGRNRNVGWEQNRTDKKEAQDDGKGKAPGSLSKPFNCLWEGCRAAMTHQETRAGRDSCHVCNRPEGTSMNRRFMR